jgi:hypothetical protein
MTCSPILIDHIRDTGLVETLKHGIVLVGATPDTQPFLFKITVMLRAEAKRCSASQEVANTTPLHVLTTLLDGRITCGPI